MRDDPFNVTSAGGLSSARSFSWWLLSSPGEGRDERVKIILYCKEKPECGKTRFGYRERFTTPKKPSSSTEGDKDFQVQNFLLCIHNL